MTDGDRPLPPAPGLGEVARRVAEFAAHTAADRSWTELLAATAGRPDPARTAHRAALLVWLNAWGCRIRYPRPGEPDGFGVMLERWWQRWAAVLPEPGTAMVALSDDAVAVAGGAYADLTAARRPAPERRLGPTGAAKLLHALRPNTFQPWDAAIAAGLHGGTGVGAWAAHQRLGRDWGRALLTEAGTTEADLSRRLGRPGRPLTKLIDDHLYLVFTRAA